MSSDETTTDSPTSPSVPPTPSPSMPTWPGTVDKGSLKRNTVAEVSIMVGAVIVIVYSLLLSLLSYILILANTSAKIVGIILTLVILLALGLIVQAVRLLIQRKRTDHYSQRLTALALILTSPIIAIACAFISNDSTLPFRVLVLVPAGMSVTGLVWLHVLLSKKNRVMWLQESIETSAIPKKPVTQVEQEMAANAARKRKRAYLFLTLPMAAFITFEMIHWIAYLADIYIEMPFALILDLLQFLIGLLIVPSAIMAIVLLMQVRKR